MPKEAKELTALEVKRLQHDGRNGNAIFAVGGVAGLYIQITPNAARSWLLRTTVGSRRRELGLGGYPEISLAAARDKARALKEDIRGGVDPVEQRKAAKAELEASQRRGLSFEEATAKYLSTKLDEFKNAKHRQQWENTLKTYAIPELGKMLVDQITVQDVLRVLEPIWNSKTETASRLRGRIEAVLSWATVAGHRSGDNPARWAGNLKELLPAANKVAKKENHPAVQIDDANRWFAAIREREGASARALEFVALTATRSQEVCQAKWDEFDLEAGIWIIPAAHMKKEREHRIPLTPDALKLLLALPRFKDDPVVFAAPRGGELSNGALLSAMQRLHLADKASGGPGFEDRVSKRPAVPHGLRSTFRDWVSERTHFPGDMAEFALAHKLSSAVEAAYRRGDMVEKRRTMMMAWADFLNGRADTSGNVISFAVGK